MVLALGVTSFAWPKFPRKIDVKNTLSETQANVGLDRGEEGYVQEALTWFAQAGATAGEGTPQERVNFKRLQTWCVDFPIPIAAIRHSVADASHEIVFHPNNKLLKINSWRLDTSGKKTRFPPIFYDIESGSVWRPDWFGDGAVLNWDHTGNYIAQARSGLGVIVWSLDRKQPHIVINRGVYLSVMQDIKNCVFSPNGRYLAIVDHTTQIYDLNNRISPALVAEFEGSRFSKDFLDVTFSADSRRFAVTLSSGDTEFYRIDRNAEQVAFLYQSSMHLNPSPIYLSPSQDVLIQSQRGAISRLDADSGEVLHTLNMSESVIYDFSICKQSRDLYVSGSEFISRYGLRSGFSNRFEFVEGQSLNNYSVNVCGEHVIVGSDQPFVRFFSKGGEERDTVYHTDDVVSVGVSKHARFFATIQADGLVRVWRTPQPLFDLATISASEPNIPVLSKDGDYFSCVTWLKERKHLASRVYNSKTLQPESPLLRSAGYLNGGTFSPDSNLLVQLSAATNKIEQAGGRFLWWNDSPGRISIWDWKRGELFVEPIKTKSEPIDAAFISEGKRLVVVCADGTLFVFSVPGFQLEKTLNAGGKVVLAHDVKPGTWIEEGQDGALFYTFGFGNRATLWDAPRLTEHTLITRRPNFKLASLSVQNDSFLYTLGGKSTVFKFAYEDKETVELMHPQSIRSMRFNPAEDHFITICDDGKIRVWNVKSEDVSGMLTDNASTFDDACYIQNGNAILTLDEDGYARVWETESLNYISRKYRLTNTQKWIISQANVVLIPSKNGPYRLIADRLDFRESVPDSLKSRLVDLAAVVSGFNVSEGRLQKLTTAEWLAVWERTKILHRNFHRFFFDDSGTKLDTIKRQIHDHLNQKK